MSDQLRNVLLVIVGFRVEFENSVGYMKLKNPDDAKLGATVNRMIHDHEIDFISIRAIDVVARKEG